MTPVTDELIKRETSPIIPTFKQTTIAQALHLTTILYFVNAKWLIDSDIQAVYLYKVQKLAPKAITSM